MILFDVNVLPAAHRADHPHRGLARGFIDDTMRRNESFGVPSTVWGSFLRLTTNRRVFTVPTPLSEAFAFVSAVVGQPNHLACEPGAAHLELFERMCLTADAGGDLVPDAQLAAQAIEHGAMLVSFDRDFARFDDLDWAMPAR